LNKTLEKDRLQAESPSSVKPSPQSGGERKWLMPVVLCGGALAIVLLAFAVGRGTSGGSAPREPATPPAAAAPAAATNAPPAKRPPVEPPPPAPPAAPDAFALQIESVPAGAAIVLDGQATSQVTPATVKLSGPGPHRLRLSKPGYVTQEVNLEDGDLKQGAVSYTLAAAEAAGIAVSIDSPYPVEVISGSQTLARAGQSHRLKIAPGTTIRVVSRQYMLNETLRVASRPVSYDVPAPGFLTVLTNHETCNVKIGDSVLGFPPITKHPIAAGSYRVDIACPDGPSPAGETVTVPANGTATARIR
jgi:hypothetical protein